MALVKRTYVDGETIITAQNLNDIQDEIISHANTFVPKTRTINSKALDANITLTASDLGAVPTTRTVNSKALSSNITLTSGDIGYNSSTTYTSGTVGAAVSDLNGAITSLQNVDTVIENGLAIIVTGDTCSTAVPSGGCAYIKNNTHGLTDGLYRNKTASAFPTSGGTANSTVFESIPNGGFNNPFEFNTSGSDTALTAYAKFPNGMLICWGGVPTYAASVTTKEATITFPVAFVGTYSLSLSVANNANGYYNDSRIYYFNHGVNGFSARSINEATGAQYGTPSGKYLAIGRWKW